MQRMEECISYESASTGSNPLASATSASPPSPHGSSSSESLAKKARVKPSGKKRRTLKKVCPKPPSPAQTASSSARPTITEPQEPMQPMQATSLDESEESSLQVKMSPPVPARTISINKELFEMVQIEDHLNPSPPLPLSCLRLLVSPLRLVSAAIWQTVQRKVVSDYGILEEFVSKVTDIVPELLSRRHRAQLILCLRARVTVELCRSEATADFNIIQPHLDRMHILTSTWLIEPGATTMKQESSNFSDRIKTLLENPEQREHFFQNVFPEEFGAKFDKELNTLIWLFLSRFEHVLSRQTLQQVASMLCNVPFVLEECMEAISHSEELKTLLDYQKDPRQLQHSNCSYDGSRVFSALDLFSVEKGPTDNENEESEPHTLCDMVSLRSGTESKSQTSSIKSTENDTTVERNREEIVDEPGVINGSDERMRPLYDEETTPNEESGDIVDTEATRPLYDEETTLKEESADNVDTEGGRRKKFQSPNNCSVLLKELDTSLDTSLAFHSRALRRNRDLEMKLILLQEKRGLHGEESPACSSLSTLQPAASESLSISGSVLPSVNETVPDSATPPEVSDDEASVGSDIDPSYFAPTESYDDESSSRSSDEKPSTVANVDDSVMCKAQNDRHPKPATAKETNARRSRGRCFICNEQMKTTMMAHLKSHFPNGDYACPRCNTKFKNVSSFMLHIKRTCFDQQQVSPEEGEEVHCVFKCVECEKAFRYQQSLTEHKRTHNKLYCEVCRRVLRNEDALARHKASHTPFQCTLCEEHFRLYKPLARHYENVHQMSRPFKCNHCPKSFSKLSYFIRHEWKHTGQLPFQCVLCAMGFRNDADLVSHLRVHTREKPFLCTECGKAFSQRTNLKRHWDYIHGHRRNERRYSCSQCEASFREKGSLRKHEKSKHLHQLFRFPCPDCGKLFSSSALGRHKLIHTGEKPFKCKMPDCDKYFRSRGEVKRHIMQAHTEERPFKCDICKKGFIRDSILRVHMRIHSGDKPYVCSVCGKGFPQLYSMKRHKVLVHAFTI